MMINLPIWPHTNFSYSSVFQEKPAVFLQPQTCDQLGSLHIRKHHQFKLQTRCRIQQGFFWDDREKPANPNPDANPIPYADTNPFFSHNLHHHCLHRSISSTSCHQSNSPENVPSQYFQRFIRHALSCLSTRGTHLEFPSTWQRRVD